VEKFHDWSLVGQRNLLDTLLCRREPMIIRKRRVRNPSRYLALVKKGTRVVIGVEDIERFRNTLITAGFTDDLKVGESVLPLPAFGPVSRHNAEGKYIVHRDQPMETAYRVVEWEWKEWHGPYRVERSDFRDVPYKRYPRTFVSPPSVEMRIATTPDEQRLVVSPPVEYVDANEQLLRHTINLYLEMFRECSVFTENLDEIIRAPVIRLNWRILPPGRWPWSELRREVEPLLERAPGGKQAIIRHRLEVVNGYGPDFVAVGQAGFRGYVVFGFTERNLFVFESIYTGNATYVFDERWEELSMLTKAEILSEDLQTDRVIHRSNWDNRIRALLSA
jgi:hypothetical protein